MEDLRRSAPKIADDRDEVGRPSLVVALVAGLPDGGSVEVDRVTAARAREAIAAHSLSISVVALD